MKLTDYLVHFLEKKGVRYSFGVTGGAACHIFDSLAKSSQIKTYFNHHEQASALAAVASSKYNDVPAVTVVTTGPAGTNTLTGVLAAWQDSTPMIVVSGQARSTQLSAPLKNIRQRALQEFNIANLVQPITKFAETVMEPSQFPQMLEQAWVAAHEGRPGPVWIDIPLDMQWRDVPEHGLSASAEIDSTGPAVESEGILFELSQAIKSAKRPVFLVGGGCRQDKPELNLLLKTLSIPVVTSWQGANLIDAGNQSRCLGRVGVYGQRGANFCIQNADLVIAMGTSLGSCIIGNIPENFAREAQVYSINIDCDELSQPMLEKLKSVPVPVKEALGFLQTTCREAAFIEDWLKTIEQYKYLNELDYSKLPWMTDNFVESYKLISELSAYAGEQDVFVADGGGTVLFSTFQAVQLRQSQQLHCTTSICAMGTGLPESIGIATSANMAQHRVFCFIGDGSLQFNVQELQTIRHHNLNIKILVVNNDGYQAIKQTQKDYFESKFVGTCEQDLTLPETKNIAVAYGIDYVNLRTEQDIKQWLRSDCQKMGPQVIEIYVDPCSEVFPVQDKTFNEDGTSTPLPLERMAPQLSDDEFKRLMKVPMV